MTTTPTDPPLPGITHEARMRAFHSCRLSCDDAMALDVHFLRLAKYTDELAELLESERSEHAKTRDDNKRNHDKWWDYEQEFILPCFKLAAAADIDLPELVREAKGNAVVRLVTELVAERDALAAKLEETLAKYHELILEVGTVYPGESRHATALRFIREREPLNRIGEAATAADNGHRLEAAGKEGA